MTPPTPTLLDLIILILAAYRLFRLAAWDTITEPIRWWVTGYDDHGGMRRRRPDWIGDLWGCPFCLGFWISAALVGAWWWEPGWTLAVALVFAVSAGCALVATRLDPA